MQYNSSLRINGARLFATLLMLGIFDGMDISSMGQTLTRLSAALGLSSWQIGVCASASTLGLAIGAAFGGRLSDRFGRGAVVYVTVLLFGICSVATAGAWDFRSLWVLRLITGLGLGGLMPVLVAIASDTASIRFRSTAIGLVMASGGLGGMLAGLVALHPKWQTVFIVGGLGPVAVLPLLPSFGTARNKGDDVASHNRLPVATVLFGSGRAGGTLAIWSIAFCTSLVSYVMINWLPSLLVRQGLGERYSHLVTIVYAAGGIVGNVTAGRLMDRGAGRLAYALGYIGAGMGLLGLSAVGAAPAGIIACAFGVNLAILCAQLVTISLAASYYPAQARATGVGAMLAAGRIGSVVGPALIGALLGGGVTASHALQSLIPGLAVSLVLALVFERKAREATATAP